MLEVQYQGTEELIPFVDLHTHLGKERVLDPTGREAFRSTTLRDIIDFYEKVGHTLQQRLKEDQIYKFKMNSPGKPISPLMKNLLENTNEKRVFGWIADHIAVFPFNDVIAERTNPKFQMSNDRVFIRSRDPQFGRIIPFCRVDPFDGNKALEEVKRCVSLGARGLKLHPLSQNFVDKIVSEDVINVLEFAGSIGLPVIFDVANEGVGADIGKVVEAAKSKIGSDSKLKVILGHFGFDYSSQVLHDLLKRPEMFTELSGCRGKDVSLFFEKLVEFNGLSGLEKVAFGSDYNYFGVTQCIDFTSYILSNAFSELVGEENCLQSVKKVLGLNALSLFEFVATPSLSEQKNTGLKQISTINLSNQIQKVLKNRKISIRPQLLAFNTDITIWTVQKENQWSFCFLSRNIQDKTLIFIPEEFPDPKSFETMIKPLKTIKINKKLKKFDLPKAIKSYEGDVA